ncbi:hypothetical protein LWI29_036273 [Acer saccharum]|uniref:Uncharacterized protein n=1 Tax=Acer saccharum TaxID=4024 RepID=A0AA39S1A3_ACESA|nr:hypothetical protein LWI29_036273 [Acer saccharum]
MTLSRHRRRSKKANGIDRVSQKEAAAQLDQGIAHLDQDPVEHVYEPDLNVSSEPSVQRQEDSPARPRDPKRKPSSGTSTRRVAKETAGRKVVKTVAGSSAPEASRAQKAVTIEVGPEAHHVRVMVEDLDEEGEDHETSSDLIFREHRSKSKSDRPATVHTPLSFDLVQCVDQDPRPFSAAMAQATQIPTRALFDLPVKPLTNPPTKLTVSRQLVLTDSDEEANNEDVSPKCLVDQADKIPMDSSR